MATEGIGLYVHVPYCLRKCSYCAFASETKPDDISGMCTALMTEFDNRTKDGDYSFRTFYAGGGTPSLLPPEFWHNMISRISSPTLMEATIETNPAVLDGRGYSTLLLAGFNRISIGVQSFSEENLKKLGRIHSAEQGREALELARKTGFRKISADLIYGIPGQKERDLKKELESMLCFRPEHLSLYELTLEKGTPMGDRGEKAEEEECADMYQMAHELLTNEGYHHYEVSSYSLGEENIAVHNSSYWQRIPYMGIGPSAHSFDGRRRSWNHSDTIKYESAVVRGRPATESAEDLTGENAANELLSLGFRHTGGVDLADLRKLGYMLDPTELLQTGLLKEKNGVLIPDANGMLFADSLALKATQLLEELPGFDE